MQRQCREGFFSTSSSTNKIMAKLIMKQKQSEYTDSRQKDSIPKESITQESIRERVMRDGSITAFQRKVYLALLEVERGETITYKELAERIHCKSAQAVGQALKHNPFAPDVPCHRVVSSNGSVGGYFGRREGPLIELKKRLLEEEVFSIYNL